jgi:3,4-dihydroxy 2-butanone 4-phosphate synthase/GTP cyclohydrolase II
LQRADAGVLVLLHQTESADDLRDRALNVKPLNAHKMDLRTYGIGAQILRALCVGKMRVLAKPRRMPSMTGFDLEVVAYEER